MDDSFGDHLVEEPLLNRHARLEFDGAVGAERIILPEQVLDLAPRAGGNCGSGGGDDPSP
jgi:hypothetical protein